MLNYRKIGKRAQIGETITWIIATLIIIGTLVVFIFFSVLMSKVKNIAIGDIKTDLTKESVSLNVKTSLAHQIANNKNKEIIDNILKENDK